MLCQIRCTLRGWIYRSLFGYGHFPDVVRRSHMDGLAMDGLGFGREGPRVVHLVLFFCPRSVVLTEIQQYIGGGE